MKSLIVHYMNKYPGGRVDSNEYGLSVYNADGELVVKMEKDALGAMKCVSEDHGAVDRHCLGALPRWARRWKISKDGKIAKDEKFEERTKHVKAYGEYKIPGAIGRPSEGEPDFSKGHFDHKEAKRMESPKTSAKESSDDSQDDEA